MRATLPLTLVALASVATAQRIVLPDNQNFMESSTYGTCAADTTYWRTTAGRFQIIYNASHFTASRTGISGPITITRLRFRGEDGEANLGGQVYSNVLVQLGSTSLTDATMVTTFGSATGGGPGTAGSNRDPLSTTLGPVSAATTVTVAPSIGSCPNNYFIDIDLVAAGAAFTYDPFSAQPNLLIDITMPTAPTNAAPLSLLGTQDTIAHGAGVRGKAVSTATVAALTGTTDTTPAIVGLEFTGGGGYAGEVPATARLIGAGCGGQPSTFYQEFQQNDAFDIAGGFTLTPDSVSAPTVYTVTPGAGAFDVTQLNAAPNSTTDDATVPVTLPQGTGGWTFNYPGGSTTAIEPSTNGFIWLDTAMTAANFTVSRTLMLGSAVVAGDNGPRLMPLWIDMTASKNTGMASLSGLHIKEQPESAPGAADARIYVTWRDMGNFRYPGSATVFGHAVWNVQCMIDQATGKVEYRYGTCQPFFSALGGVYTNQTGAAIVGFTRGRIAGVASVDPGSRDLSDPALLPYTTAVEGSTGNVLLTAVSAPVAGSALQTGRMFNGQTLTYTVSNVPPPVGLSLAILSFDVGAPTASFPLAFAGLSPAGCTTAFPNILPVVLNFASALNVAGGTIPIAPGIGPIPEHNDPGSWATLGLNVTAQVWGLDFGAPFLVPWTSNTIHYTIGLD